jgi:hypothetical protein
MVASPLPRLSVGAHLVPEDGACLMEVVSAHAGEPWSDAPSCTHPLLAHLARLVNDAFSDGARHWLHGEVAGLVGAQSNDPAVYPRVALACTTVALRHHRSLLLTHLDLAARAQLRRETDRARNAQRRLGLWRRLYQRGPAHRAVEASVLACASLPTGRRDQVLLDLLRAALAALHDRADVRGPVMPSRPR